MLLTLLLVIAFLDLALLVGLVSFTVAATFQVFKALAELRRRMIEMQVAEEVLWGEGFTVTAVVIPSDGETPGKEMWN